MTTENRPYSVALWGSEPMTNDDCNTSGDYPNHEEAEAALYQVVSLLEDGEVVWHCHNTDTQYVVLDGPDVHLEVRIESFVDVEDDCSEWASEFAMQVGMALGCQGFNDAMGH